MFDIVNSKKDTLECEWSTNDPRGRVRALEGKVLPHVTTGNHKQPKYFSRLFSMIPAQRELSATLIDFSVYSPTVGAKKWRRLNQAHKRRTVKLAFPYGAPVPCFC